MGSGKIVIIMLIVLCVSKVYLSGFPVVSEDLFSIDNVMFAFLGITGNGAAGHRQFQSKLKLDRGIDHSVKTKNLLFSVGVLGISPNAYSGLHVSGQFRTSKKEGIRGNAFSHFNPGDDTSFDHQIQTGLMQLLFKNKNTIEYTLAVQNQSPLKRVSELPRLDV